MCFLGLTFAYIRVAALLMSKFLIAVTLLRQHRGHCIGVTVTILHSVCSHLLIYGLKISIFWITVWVQRSSTSPVCSWHETCVWSGLCPVISHGFLILNHVAHTTEEHKWISNGLCWKMHLLKKCLRHELPVSPFLFLFFDFKRVCMMFVVGFVSRTAKITVVLHQSCVTQYCTSSSGWWCHTWLWQVYSGSTFGYIPHLQSFVVQGLEDIRNY